VRKLSSRRSASVAVERHSARRFERTHGRPSGMYSKGKAIEAGSMSSDGRDRGRWKISRGMSAELNGTWVT
jgi:hypothetical protein